MKKITLKFALSSLLMLLPLNPAKALIPEPSNLLYGNITLDNVPLTAADAHVSLVVFIGDKEIARYTLGDDPAAGDRFVLDVPLDSISARLDGSARDGDLLVIRYQAGSIDAEVADLRAGERGRTLQLDLTLSSDAFDEGGVVPPNADSDGDGIPDQVELAMGLNPLLAADAQDDDDGDGVDNLQEYLNGTNHQLDDYPPRLTVPANKTVEGIALFTPVDVGNASAFDALDGELTPSHDSEGIYLPGRYTVTWAVSDAAGNQSTGTQLISVTPRVSFSANRLVAEGSTVTLGVALNGAALGYPVSVPYTVNGTASGAGVDYTLADGVIAINSGLRAEISFPVTLDAIDNEGTETIVITMGEPLNASRGNRDVYTARIVEGNIAPILVLQADQGTGRTGLIVAGNGPVAVTATVDDPNPGDLHSYDWSLSDNELADIDGDAADAGFVFDPAGLTPGTYRLVLNVTDSSAATGDAELLLRVVESAPVLGAADTDGDGVNDDIEGFGDQDGDGIPDYKDAFELEHVMQTQARTGASYLLEAEEGLRLSLGFVAFDSDEGDATVDAAEIEAAYQGQVSATTDSYSASGGTFDFILAGLSEPGDTARVVLPLAAAVPELAVYRKLILPGPGWISFVEDGNNLLASAAGNEGYCPSPGDNAYTSGLTQGDWCVQLTIEDGGPNDADGIANQAIKDPGNVAVADPGDDDSGGGGNGGSSSGKSSGGSGIGFWLLLALVGIGCFRRWPGIR